MMNNACFSSFGSSFFVRPRLNLSFLVRLLSIFLLPIVLMFSSNAAFAYGFLGHKIIANGAYGHLTPEARLIVDAILAEGSIADGSVWPDVMRNTGRCEVGIMDKVLAHRQSHTSVVPDVKAKAWVVKLVASSDCKDKFTDKLQGRMRQMLKATDVAGAKALHKQYLANFKDYQFWQASKPWHYVNVPPGQTYQQSTKNPSGDVIAAIETFSAILLGKGNKHPVIMQALEDYLGHLPVQTKQATMRQFALKFLVHFIGDLHQPLHSGYKADLGGNRINVSWFGEQVNLHRVWDTSLLEGQNKTQAQFELIVANVASKDKAHYSQSTVYDWVAEALELRLKVYDIERYKGKMDQAYVDEHQAVFNQQLQKASVRLAMTLNKILK